MLYITWLCRILSLMLQLTLFQMWRSNMKLTLVCILFFSLHVHMIDVGPTCKEKMSYWTFKWSNSARVHIYKCNILVIYVNISALIVWWYVFPPPFFSLQLSQIHLALEGTILWLFSLPSHPNWIKLKPSSLAPPSLWNLLILCVKIVSSMADIAQISERLWLFQWWGLKIM